MKTLSHTTLKHSVVFTSLAALWAAPTFADTAIESTLPTVEVSTTREQPNLNLDTPSSTGSRLKLSARDTPASVESVDAATMRERGDFSVSDAVTRTTGITDIATQGDGGVAYSARGFTGNNSVGVLIDGHRMLVGAGTITDPSNTWGYERIEVLRGAGSFISGTGVTGATINAIRKSPLAQTTGEVLIGVGEEGTSRLGIGGTGAIGTAGAFRIDAYTEKSDGFVDRGDSEGNKIMSTFRFDATKDLRLELQLDHNDQHPTEYWGTPLVNGAIDKSIRERNYNVSDADIKYVDDRIAGRATWQVSPNLTLSDEVSYFTANRRWFDAEEYAYNPGTNEVERFSFGEIRHRQQQIGNRLEAAYKTQSNRLVAGWEIVDITFRHDSNGFGGFDSVPLSNPNPGLFGSQETAATPNYRTKAKAYAYYVEDAYDISERLLFVAGLRHDIYDLKRTSLRTGQVVDTDLDSTALRLGLTYRLAPTTSLYVNASTASDPITSILSVNLANSRFDLTKGKQIEVGIKQGFAEGRGEWTGALYHLKKDDIITRDPVTPSISVQGGSQSSKGAEFSASYVIGGGWRVDGNLALVDAEFDELIESGGASRAGNRPNGVPTRVANLWLNYATNVWSAGVGTRYVGNTYADNANTLELLAYTVFDASLGWHVNSKTTLRAIARNIGDRVYATTTYSPTQVILGDPRHIELTAEFKF